MTPKSFRGLRRLPALWFVFSKRRKLAVKTKSQTSSLDKIAPQKLNYLFCNHQQIFNIRRFLTKFMAISANDIRKGMVILHEGNPVKVMEFHHHTPGNLRAMVQARLRNLLTGNSFEYRFRSNDTLERVVLEQHRMDYLYSDGSHHHFMNSENYEQVALTEDELGDAAQWLMPGLKIEV